jgi:anti-anti-sigma factor
MESVQVQITRDGETAMVAVSGDFDMAAAARVEGALLSVEDGTIAVIVLDLRGVTFLDSTGLRTITSADARARRDPHELRIVRGPEHIQKLLHVTGMDKILPLVDSPDETPERDG